MLLFNRLNKINYYAPEEANTGGTLSVDDVLDSLNQPDEAEEVLDITEPKKSKDTKVDKEDESEETTDEETEEDELTDLDEELTEPTDEDLEITLHVSRREIKTKYPNFFKEFPSVEKALYREQAYTEVFPTVSDAKEAYQAADTLNKFESDLISGNTEKLLTAVKSEDGNAFNKIVDNYLPTLAKVDQTAYYHVIGKVLQTTVMQMVQEAKRLGDENGKGLIEAATLLHQFTFGTTEFKALGDLAKVESVKDDNVNKERQEYNEQRFNDTKSELGGRVSNIIKGTIEQNIDPNSSMSDFVKKNAVREALDKVNELIQKDSRFKAILDKAWEHAAKNNYNNESKDKIRQVYLSKAKTLLPAIIKSTRTEALKGTNRKAKDTYDDEIDVSSNLKVNKPKDKDKSTSSVRSGKSEREQAKGIPRGTKTLDFLMSD